MSMYCHHCGTYLSTRTGKQLRRADFLCPSCSDTEMWYQYHYGFPARAAEADAGKSVPHEVGSDGCLSVCTLKGAERH